MTNTQIAEQFELLSKLMDLHGENSFKTKTYAVLAYNIEKLGVELSTLGEEDLFSIKGIGESTGRKILELLQTGHMAVLDEIIANTPAGLLDIMAIKGLGPKKIAVIWKELGIESVGELEYACNENRLVTLKGFGAKTQESILQNIRYIKQNEGFFLWSEAIEVGEGIVAALRNKFPEHLFSLSGAARRQMEVLDAVDIITDMDKMTLRKQFAESDDVLVEYVGDDVVHIKVTMRPKLAFRFVKREVFYGTLFKTTGSEEFINAFLAKYKLPEDVATEEEIFKINGLQVIPPALRESGNVLDKAAQNSLPELITKRDIKSIIHSHSKYSDGQNTIEEMAIAAIKDGYEYLVLSDHSQAAFYANGLTPERIAQQHAEIDALNIKLAPFKIFKSIEADILNDGNLDYSASVLSTFDLVIASVHSNLKMSEEKAMARVMAAIANPFTTILGHPTGRLLLSRNGYPLDHKAIIDACAIHNVVLEINAHPRRLDLDWRWIAYAIEKGVLLSIDPDAHSINGYNDVHYGAMIAQKGGLTARQNLSSYSLTEFEEFLVNVRKKKATIQLV